MNLENSLFKVTPKIFHKNLTIPTSKSFANRALILGAMKGQDTIIRNLPLSTDVQNLLNVFEQIGINFVLKANEIKFLNSFPACEMALKAEIINLKTGDGGTTNRFLIAMLARGKKTYCLFPSEKMNERPIDGLLLPLKELGVEIKKNVNGAWLTIKGPAVISSDGIIEIDCSETTQFATAMMLAFHDTAMKFSFKNVNASEQYLIMTAEIMKLQNFVVPVDFSSASYPIALATITGNVTIKNCASIDNLQADSILIDFLKKLGGDIELNEKGLRITSSKKLIPFTIDGSQCLDLVPTLVFLASKIEGTSFINNLSILRFKESDRLEEIIKILKAFEVEFSFDKKFLIACS